MRTRPALTLLLPIAASLVLAPPSMAQSSLGAPLPQTAFSPLELGSVEAAFADSPIHLSPTALAALRGHYPNDKVPLIPAPFRQQLDAALAAQDWPRVMSRKSDLGASRGQLALLMWEQTRFLATGNLWLAELNTRDLAAVGVTNTNEAAAMMWLYAAAVTLTDGHQCADPAASDAHLTWLRGPAFAPVTKIIRDLPPDRLQAMRDIAVRLEAGLAPERTGDTMCRTGSSHPEHRPDTEWQPEAARTRDMLPKHLTALTALMRQPSGPPAKPSQTKP